VGNESIEFLGGVVFYEFDCVITGLLSYSSLVMRVRRYLPTLKVSLSKSGFYLKSLQSFFVLSLSIIDKFAI
jgi:hypothetical protein